MIVMDHALPDLAHLVGIFTTVKFYEKYPQLKEKAFLTRVLSDTVFSSMALEDQHLEYSKVEKIVCSVLLEHESKGTQFFSD